MNEYIERRIAINEILTLRDYCFNDEEKHAFSLAYRKLRDAPTADVAEVKRGQWIYKTTYGQLDECNCSLCGQLMTTLEGKRMNYCCRCGAKMTEV